MGEELQLKGLTSEDRQDIMPQKSRNSINRLHTEVKQMETSKQDKMHLINLDENNTFAAKPLTQENIGVDNKELVIIYDPDYINEKTSELVIWNGNHWSCRVCGKLQDTTRNAKFNLKRHTQIHLEGLSYPCNICEKSFSSSANIKQHKYRAHKLSNLQE